MGGPSLISPRRHHKCISLHQGKAMEAGGGGLFGANLDLSAEVYDPNLGQWYQSVDLPKRPDYLLSWDGNAVMINFGEIWKLEEGVWTLLDVRTSNTLVP